MIKICEKKTSETKFISGSKYIFHSSPSILGRTPCNYTYRYWYLPAHPDLIVLDLPLKIETSLVLY
jgi:hypothetical protein